MKNPALICLLVCLFSAIFAINVFGQTFYVSPTGSDLNPGTGAMPFGSIQEAANRANPGDIIFIKKGLYKGYNKEGFMVFLNHGGNPGQWITFRAEEKWGAILEGENNAARYGFGFNNNVGYVRIEGLQLRGMRHAGFMLNSNCNNISIINNLVYEIGRRVVPRGEDGGQGVSIGAKAHHIFCKGNIFHTIGRFPSGSPQDHNNDHGIYPKGNYVEIEDNIFYDFKAGWAIHIYGGKGEQIYIHHNTFADQNPGRPGQILVTSDQKDIRIENNIFYKTNDCAIKTGSGSTLRVLNNLVSSRAKLLCGEPSSESLISNNLLGMEPEFIAPKKRDYRLKRVSGLGDSTIHKKTQTEKGSGNAEQVGASLTTAKTFAEYIEKNKKISFGIRKPE